MTSRAFPTLLLMGCLAAVPHAEAKTVKSLAQQAEHLRKLKARAEGGDAEAQLSLGLSYQKGYYQVTRDPEAARAWLVRAAQAGNARAYYEAGAVLLATQPAEAEGWLLKALAAGDLRADRGLCDLYLTSPLHNWDKALTHCRKTAERGDTKPYSLMARTVEAGEGDRTASQAGAMTMYAELSRWGDEYATTRLADIYDERPSGPGTDAELLRYSWKAAGFNPRFYLVRLARYHETGRAVAADAQEAGRIYFYAARLGATQAVTWLEAHPEVTEAALEARRLPGDTFASSPLTITDRQGENGVSADYPERAYEDQVEGDVTIECRITAAGEADNCLPVKEYPRGYGFGTAALRLDVRATDPGALKSHAGKLVRTDFDWKLY